MIDQSEIALEIKDTLEVGHTSTSEVDPSHAKFTCKRCPPKGDTQTMINQSEIGLDIKDTVEVGHTNTSEVIWLATTMYHSVVTSVRIL